MSRFIKKRYRNFKSYTPGEQPQNSEYLKLNTNESPYPPAESVLEALKNIDIQKLRLYPDPSGTKLKKKLTEIYKVGTENIFLSNGSADILNFFVMAFNDDEDELVIPDIAYTFYEVLARLHNVKYQIEPLMEDMSIDWMKYCGIRKNIILPNPNSPTGIALTRNQVEEIVKTNKDNIILVDEAYVDFGAETAIPLIKEYDNVLISQTFSKSRSFAGGRLGFAIADKEIIKDLERIQYSTNPYNVNTISLIMAEAALDADNYYRDNSLKIQKTRNESVKELKKRGFTVLPSSANYVFTKHSEISGEKLFAALKDKGILVRHFENKRICDYIRITIGTDEQMKFTFQKIDEILKENMHN